MENRTAKAPEDQRVRMTKNMLKEAFLSLLYVKPVQNITVKQLCEKAGVNRGTFYLHYRDVYDLLEKMENEFLGEVAEVLSDNPVLRHGASEEVSSTFVASLFTFVEKNKELCAILLGDNGDKKFVEKIIAMGREKSVKEYSALFPAATKQQTEVFYAFIAWGFLGLLQYGLQNPSVSFKTLVASAERIVAEAARFFEQSV